MRTPSWPPRCGRWLADRRPCALRATWQLQFGRAFLAASHGPNLAGAVNISSGYISITTVLASVKNSRLPLDPLDHIELVTDIIVSGLRIAHPDGAGSANGRSGGDRTKRRA
jgi:hypothetical protein